MSHLRTCTTKITSCNEEILRAAVQMVATDLGYTIGTIRSYAGQEVKCLVGVQIPSNYGSSNNGYGVKIENGQLQVVGDDFGHTYKMEEFTSRVSAAYRSIAYASQLRKQGNQVNVQRKANQYIVVGVKA